MYEEEDDQTNKFIANLIFFIHVYQTTQTIKESPSHCQC